jgi:hypothetical protein
LLGVISHRIVKFSLAISAVPLSCSTSPSDATSRSSRCRLLVRDLPAPLWSRQYTGRQFQHQVQESEWLIPLQRVNHRAAIKR